MALRVKLLTEHGILPARGSAFAAGYDLCSAYAGVVPARGKALLKTDIAIAVPPGTYGRVAPRSGLTLKNGIDVGAGVIGACRIKGPFALFVAALSCLPLYGHLWRTSHDTPCSFPFYSLTVLPFAAF